VLPFVFVVILIVGAVLGFLIDGRLQDRERAFGDALERHPAAAQVVENIAERNELDLRDIVQHVPKASPQEFEAALSAVENRSLRPSDLEAAIVPDAYDRD
jgi:hypothetical protein